MRREETQSCHVHAARAQRVQDARQASRRAGDGNSLAGNILREPILADAEREHRGKRTIEVQLALLDLSKVLKDVCLGASRLLHELSRGGEELRGAQRLDDGA